MPDQPPDEISNEIQQLLQRAVLNNYPNPERRGCPGSAVLQEVASRRVPLRDAHWEHVTHCSPCFQEFLEFRRDFTQAERTVVRRSRIILAAGLAVAGIAGILIWKGPFNPSPRVITPQAYADIDMRPFSAVRGDNLPPTERYAGILTRKPSQLNLILPIGAQEGTYEVRLMDNDLQHTVASGQAQASLVDHMVKLTITFDLTSVTSGPYVIASRLGAGGWMTSPVLIR
jgi:hypothetical protein